MLAYLQSRFERQNGAWCGEFPTCVLYVVSSEYLWQEENYIRPFLVPRKQSTRILCFFPPNSSTVMNLRFSSLLTYIYLYIAVYFYSRKTLRGMLTRWPADFFDFAIQCKILNLNFLSILRLRECSLIRNDRIFLPMFSKMCLSRRVGRGFGWLKMLVI